MKYRVFIILFLTLTACSTNVEKAKIKQDSSNEIIYAKHLQIHEEQGSVRVEILHPETGKPTFKAILAKSRPDKVPSEYIFIQTPVKDLAVLSATQIGMLSKLDELNRISAVSSRKYIYNAAILRSIDQGKVRDLGDESLIPAESIISSGSKFLFYSDFGQAFPHAEQLKKMGITIVPNPDWREVHPLGKAEWIKLLGYLTGKENEAKKIFTETCQSYEKLIKIGSEQQKKPNVISGNMLGDVWWAPSGESYNAKIFKDAGGNYIYSSTRGTGSVERTAEQIIHENKGTEFWFNPGFSSKNEILRNSPKLKHLQLLKNGKIFCYSHNMNFYWEMSAIEPHLVLEDLIRILHPKALPEGKMYFYKEVK
jgi:iron complex transport system substrate-binding protein